MRFLSPAAGERTERLGAVLHVLYLIFNKGYAASAGQSLQRNDPEVAGLLALMWLADARRTACTGPHGEAIPLDKQERTLWDRRQIDEGEALLGAALPKGSVGPYQIQAAIAAVHDEATRSEDTDWPQILALYKILQRMSDNPMVRLNHAVAAGMVHGPAAGLDLSAHLDLDERLKGYHRLEAVRGHLKEMTGDSQGAIASYRTAASRIASLPERNFLLEQAARLRAL